jgi:hypothetical protein
VIIGPSLATMRSSSELLVTYDGQVYVGLFELLLVTSMVLFHLLHFLPNSVLLLLLIGRCHQGCPLPACPPRLIYEPL